MKKINAVIVTGIFLLMSQIHVLAQSAPQAKTYTIAPYRLAITFHKTTNLVFPYAIKSVDRGSRDVLAQKAKGFENVLQIKAGIKNFEETNLTVITADGKLYSYILDYTDNPSQLNIRFAKTPGEPAVSFPEGKTNQAELENTAANVASQKRTLHGIADKKYGMKLQLQGIYIKNDVFYFQFSLRNQSTIDYGIDQFRFYTGDQQKIKRTASQELEIRPLYSYGDTSSVSARSKKVLVFALAKFTIPDQKYFRVQVMEKNGGRHLEVKLYNKQLIRARQIK